jgi:hypothetical protein
MKKGLFILLLFILSTIQHDFVTLSYKGNHMNNFGENTSALITTSECGFNFDQSIDKQNSIAQVPIVNTPIDEQTSLTENFFSSEIQFVEDLFLKIKSLSPIKFEFLKRSNFNCIISETDEFLFGCSFRL